MSLGLSLGTYPDTFGPARHANRELAHDEGGAVTDSLLDNEWDADASYSAAYGNTPARAHHSDCERIEK